MEEFSKRVVRCSGSLSMAIALAAPVAALDDYKCCKASDTDATHPFKSLSAPLPLGNNAVRFDWAVTTP